MKVVIQIAARDNAKAWSILVRHSAGTALPNRTFIVSDTPYVPCAKPASALRSYFYADHRTEDMKNGHDVSNHKGHKGHEERNA
jgi:hypothetical protein